MFQTLTGIASLRQPFDRAQDKAQDRRRSAPKIDAPVAVSIGGEGDGRAIGREDGRVLLGGRRLSKISGLATFHRQAHYIRLVAPLLLHIASPRRAGLNGGFLNVPG